MARIKTASQQGVSPRGDQVVASPGTPDLASPAPGGPGARAKIRKMSKMLQNATLENSLGSNPLSAQQQKVSQGVSVSACGTLRGSPRGGPWTLKSASFTE